MHVEFYAIVTVRDNPNILFYPTLRRYPCVGVATPLARERAFFYLILRNGKDIQSLADATYADFAILSYMYPGHRWL